MFKELMLVVVAKFQVLICILKILHWKIDNIDFRIRNRKGIIILLSLK